MTSVFSNIRVFSSESTLCISWPKYWSYSFSISPSNEYLRLISFKIDWFDLFALQGTLKSLLQHHSLKASTLSCSAFFMFQLTSIYYNWKNHSFVGKVMSSFQCARYVDYSFSSKEQVFPVKLRLSLNLYIHLQVQFSSVAQSCLTLCDTINCSMPGLPVQHQLPEFTQTHVHRVGDAIQPSHPLSSPSPLAPQSLPASESFPISQLFSWGGQSTGVSALASVPPMNTQTDSKGV